MYFSLLCFSCNTTKKNDDDNNKSLLPGVAYLHFGKTIENHPWCVWPRARGMRGGDRFNVIYHLTNIQFYLRVLWRLNSTRIDTTMVKQEQYATCSGLMASTQRRRQIMCELIFFLGPSVNCQNIFLFFWFSNLRCFFVFLNIYLGRSANSFFSIFVFIQARYYGCSSWRMFISALFFKMISHKMHTWRFSHNSSVLFGCEKWHRLILNKTIQILMKEMFK